MYSKLFPRRSAGFDWSGERFISSRSRLTKKSSTTKKSCLLAACATLLTFLRERPTLILWGAKDQLIPVGNAKLFADAIANSEVVIFDALGHIPQEEDPLLSVAPVLRFLETRACAECGVP